MPKVLTKLRIDEISSVDRGAGDGCKVVLYKRDTRRKAFGYAMPSDFAKATYRGGTGSRLHMIQNLTPQEAAHFLLHDPHGRQLRRDFSDVPFAQLVDHVCTASRRSVEKHEVSNMDSTLKTILKSESATHALCKVLAKNGGVGFSHVQFDREVLEPYARNKYPALHVGSAIAKILSEEREISKAYEAVHAASYPNAVAKAQPVADDDEDDDEDDERNGDNGDDALAELEEQAREERRRNPKLSKAQAFTKIYTDPSNAALVRRERAANRPR
jgi:hypothetical protein